MASTLDFRFLDEGLGGQKNKKRKQPEAEAPPQSSKDSRSLIGGTAEQQADVALATASQPDDDDDSQRSSKRTAIADAHGKPTYDGTIAGKVSGRKWKSLKSGPVSSLKVSGRKSTLEERNQQRQIRKAYLERKRLLKEQIRSNKAQKRQLKEERKKRKEENELRTGTMLQKISNPKTLKKMSKKHRKMLRKVPD